MTPQNAIATTFQLAIVLGFLIILLLILRPSARGLLNELLKIPAGTTFYLRSFVVVLGLIALENFDAIDLHPDAAFMQYVWAATASLQEMLEMTYVTILIYAGFFTILAAALRGRHVQ